MQNHKVVSREGWLVARKEHLIKEKEFTRLRDELSRQRRELPWEVVNTEYVFEGPTGKQTLPELFEDRSQLIVYHFMYPPSWSEGCKSCSFWADNYNGIIGHLNHRDVTMVTISKAPLEKLEAFRRRMGWQFKWFSSFGNDFNRDYQVSFTPDEMAKGEMYYNYRMSKFPVEEAPGISVFYKDKDGNVFHTYSCYSRGLDMLNGAYHYLDLVPKGRDEDHLSYSMEWLRHHDRYDDQLPFLRFGQIFQERNDAMSIPFTGSCICGAVRYECSAEPIVSLNCHCRDCQRAGGGAFAPALAVSAAALKITGQVKYYDTKGDSGHIVSRGFCPDCGARLFFRTKAKPDLTAILAGSLDDPSWYRPTVDIHVPSAQPWDYMNPNLPKFHKMPQT